MSDNVNHPSHYNQGKIEVIDFIEDQRLDFNAGNVVKYITRHKRKGGLEDLQKAFFYLGRMIGEHTRIEAALKAAQDNGNACAASVSYGPNHPKHTAESSSSPKGVDLLMRQRAEEKRREIEGTPAGGGFKAVDHAAQTIKQVPTFPELDKPRLFARKLGQLDVEEVIEESATHYTIERPKSYSDFRREPIREYWHKEDCVTYKTRAAGQKDTGTK